jgi:Rrf2 family transcriptional regulator, cysteine metabolism repressor
VRGQYNSGSDGYRSARLFGGHDLVLALSTRGRYAARIMVNLAQRAGVARATKQQVAAGEGLSAAYVEQIMIRLKAAGLVRSLRGRHGGFCLARDPAGITLAEVLAAVEGPISALPCLPEGNCPRAEACPTRPVWREAVALLAGLFERTTIGQMAQAGDGTGTDAATAYRI